MSTNGADGLADRVVLRLERGSDVFADVPVDANLAIVRRERASPTCGSPDRDVRQHVNRVCGVWTKTADQILESIK